MNGKLILVGGLAYYVVTMILGFGVTGPLIHEGVLEGIYPNHAEFWRPELNQDPPDMGPLMPRWITLGLISAFIVAAIYDCVRSAFHGPGWRRGLVFGLCLAGFACALMGGWSGIFNLPDKIWMWWGIETFIYLPIGGAVLGWVAEKVAPQ